MAGILGCKKAALDASGQGGSIMRKEVAVAVAVLESDLVGLSSGLRFPCRLNSHGVLKIGLNSHGIGRFRLSPDAPRIPGSVFL